VDQTLRSCTPPLVVLLLSHPPPLCSQEYWEVVHPHLLLHPHPLFPLLPHLQPLPCPLALHHHHPLPLSLPLLLPLPHPHLHHHLLVLSSYTLTASQCHVRLVVLASLLLSRVSSTFLVLQLYNPHLSLASTF